MFFSFFNMFRFLIYLDQGVVALPSIIQRVRTRRLSEREACKKSYVELPMNFIIRLCIER